MPEIRGLGDGRLERVEVYDQEIDGPHAMRRHGSGVILPVP
ncbi:MAG TPA: hypothetical protein VH678_33635 [Xanthobacteraceae bacterium]|jgi:hypothetical protein